MSPLLMLGGAIALAVLALIFLQRKSDRRAAKAPIELIVAADEPALFFTSIKAAEAYLEPVDVEDGVYPAAFARDGTPYRISTDGRRVRIEPTGGEPEPGNLRALLTRYLSETAMPASSTESLAELIERCPPDA